MIPGIPTTTGQPQLDTSLDALLASARGERPVRLGQRWRLRAARWPTDTSDECLLFEAMVASRWTPVLALTPDGTWETP